MKKYLWLLLMLIASSSLAAQQTVTFPPDYKVMNRATKYNANFTELYGLPSYGISSSDISTWNAKQNRVSGVCGTGYAIRTVNVDGTVTCEATGGGGVSTWLGLTDTPAAYTANYWVKVNAAGTGLELTVAPTGSGDMTGPGSSTDNHLVLFSGTAGTATKQGQCYEDAGKLYCPEFGTTKPDGERYLLITNPGDPTVTCDASLDGAWTYNLATHTRIECKGGTWVPVSSGGSGNVILTEGATAPTAGSLPEGSLYHYTTDHTLYLQTATGLLHSAAWSWTPNAATYSLTVDMVDGNGVDKFTYLGTDYTTDQTFSGLTADSTFTVTADTGRAVSCTGTGLTDNGSDSYTANTDNENVTATCTYSASGVAMSHHFKFDAAGGTGNDQIYDEVTGTWVGSGASTVTFTTDGARTIIQSDADTDRVSVPALDNINYSDQLTIEVTTKTSVVDDVNLFSYRYTDNGDYLYYRPVRTNTTATIDVRSNFGAIASADFPSVAADTWHTVRALIDFTNKTLDIYVDGSLQSHSADTSELADWTTLSGDLFFAYVNSGTNIVSVDDVKIWHGLVIP